MRINFELDKLCGNLPKCRELAYPANMELQWRRWIELGLPTKAVFRSYGIPFRQILADPTTNAIADAALKREFPSIYNRYVNLTSDIQSDIETIRTTRVLTDSSSMKWIGICVTTRTEPPASKWPT